MTVAEKLNLIAENEQRVYDAGYSQSKLDFWNIIMNNRTDWAYLFYGWGAEHIRPPFIIKPSQAINTFFNCSNLKVLEKEYFDFSSAICSETVLDSGIARTFYGCKNLEHIEDLGIPAGAYQRTYNNCIALKIIDVMRVTKNTKYNYPFNNCPSLEEIKQIDGEIGENGFDVSGCSKLSHDTLMRIINALYDYSQDTSGTTWKVPLGSTNLAKLTAEEKEMAYAKGWTLA